MGNKSVLIEAAWMPKTCAKRKAITKAQAPDGGVCLFVCVCGAGHPTLTVTAAKVVFVDRHGGRLNQTHFKLLVHPKVDLFWAFVRNLWNYGNTKRDLSQR